MLILENLFLVPYHHVPVIHFSLISMLNLGKSVYIGIYIVIPDSVCLHDTI